MTAATTILNDGIVAIDTEYVRPLMDASHLIVQDGRGAFVDTGTGRTSFLHVADIAGYDNGNQEEKGGSQSIMKYLHEGKKVIVQVTKDPLGSKGARLTTQLSVSSRYLVFMPEVSNVGVSQRIEDEAERTGVQHHEILRAGRLRLGGCWLGGRDRHDRRRGSHRRRQCRVWSIRSHQCRWRRGCR